MSVKFDIEIEGQKEALRILKTMDLKLRRRVVSRAVNQATKPMVKAARAKSLPRRTGALWKSIRRTSTRVNLQRGTVTAKVASKSTKGQRRKGFDAFYAHMVVGGTKAHTITTKTRKALSDGRTLFGRRVNHPGYRGRDIFNRALRSGAGVSIREFSTLFAREVYKEAAKAEQ